MAKKPTLPKSLKKSEKKAQRRFVEAYEKNYKKHESTKRAYKKAYEKLEKKYEFKKGRWVRVDEPAPQKADSKKVKPKKADAKKSKKDVAAKVSASGKKSAKKPSKKKTVKAPKVDPILDAELVEPEDLEAFSGSGKDFREIASEIDELIEAGEYEGLDPEDTDDPDLAQELAEDVFAEQDLTEVIDDEPLTAVNLTDSSLQGAEMAEEAAEAEHDELASMTRAELYKRAQELKIAGRSNMNKEQLVTALAR